MPKVWYHLYVRCDDGMWARVHTTSRFDWLVREIQMWPYPYRLTMAVSSKKFDCLDELSDDQADDASDTYLAHVREVLS